jgi:hypothetical protein
MNKLLSTLMVLIIFLSMAIVGCSNNESVEEGQILANIGEEILTLDDFNMRYALYGQGSEKAVFLNNVVIPEEVILYQAKKEGISVSKAELNLALAENLEQAKASNPEFDEEKVSKIIENQLILKKAARELIEIPVISEANKLAFYQQNIEVFMQPGAEQTFDEVKDQIEAYLIQSQSQETIMGYVTQVGLNLDIEMHMELLE